MFYYHEERLVVSLCKKAENADVPIHLKLVFNGACAGPRSAVGRAPDS